MTNDEFQMDKKSCLGIPIRSSFVIRHLSLITFHVSLITPR